MKTKTESNTVKSLEEILSFTMVNASLVSPLAVWYHNKQCQATGNKSGYEDFCASLNPEMIRMMEFYLENVKVDDVDMLNNHVQALNNPQDRMKFINEAVAYNDGEVVANYVDDFDSVKFMGRQGVTNKDFVDYIKTNNWNNLEGALIASHYLARKRAMEKEVVKMIEERGVTQIVMPASGLDTLCERMAIKYPNVQFFASDFAPTTEEKKRLTSLPQFKEQFLKPHGLESMANIHYHAVNLNFENDEVRMGFDADGKTIIANNKELSSDDNFTKEISLKSVVDRPYFDKNAKTGFCFEGIHMYIDEAHWNKIFGMIKDNVAKSEVAILVVEKPTMNEAELVSRSGEGYKDFFYNPIKIQDYFKGFGFNMIGLKTAHQLQDDVDVPTVVANAKAFSGSDKSAQDIEDAATLYEMHHCHFYAFSNCEQPKTAALDNAKNNVLRSAAMERKIAEKYMRPADHKRQEEKVAAAFQFVMNKNTR